MKEEEILALKFLRVNHEEEYEGLLKLAKEDIKRFGSNTKSEVKE